MIVSSESVETGNNQFNITDQTKKDVVHAEWYRALAKYEKSDTGKAVWQLVNTLVPYSALWVMMVWMLRHGFAYWQILPLIFAAGMSVRIFIFFHDCCHHSFFASAKANRIVGYLCGTLVFTPYEDWRHQHASHHGSSGDLDRRGHGGEIWTMTVEEYRNAPRHTKIFYRLFRMPLVMLLLGPPAIFIISQRIPYKSAGPREQKSVWITNGLLAIMMGSMIWALGPVMYLSIQIPTMCVAGALGIWMFYVQHQYEGSYWARHKDWDPIKAALAGSSYYKLPKFLQWCTGNIGLHHIHHLRPRIPNYNLQRCFDEVPEMQQVDVLTFRKSLHCVMLNLYDEASQRLVSFREAKAL